MNLMVVLSVLGVLTLGAGLLLVIVAYGDKDVVEEGLLIAMFGAIVLIVVICNAPNYKNYCINRGYTTAYFSHGENYCLRLGDEPEIIKINESEVRNAGK